MPARYRLTDNDVKELHRIRRKVDSIRGAGVVNKPGTITIKGTPNRTPRSRTAVSSSHFPARITGAARVTGDPQPWQWVYTFEELEKTTAGYGGWTIKSGGRSGDCRNLIEDVNDDAGLMGNGVNTTNLDTDEATFEIQPAPIGYPVEVFAVWSLDGVDEFFFQYENGIDGVCDAPGGGDTTISEGSY